jgi:hypothetical protein
LFRVGKRLAIGKNQSADFLNFNPLRSVDSLVLPNRTLPNTALGVPRAIAQHNRINPDIHIPKDCDGWNQSYNCQASGNDQHQITVRVGSAMSPVSCTIFSCIRGLERPEDD